MDQYTVTNQEELAIFLGVSKTTIGKYLKRGMSVCKQGGNYHVPEAVKWARENVWNQSDGVIPSQETDASLEGLERLRAARAEIAEIDLEERKATIVSATDITEALSELSSILQRYSNIAEQQREGSSSIFLEAVTEFERWVNERFPEILEAE